MVIQIYILTWLIIGINSLIMDNHGPLDQWANSAPIRQSNFTNSPQIYVSTEHLQAGSEKNRRGFMFTPVNFDLPLQCEAPVR